MRAAAIILCVLAGAVAVAFGSTSQAGALRLPVIFSDNMVLQRAPQQAVIWGWSTAGATVTAKIAGQTQDGRADGNGKWSITLMPVAATWNDPQQLVVTSTVDGSVTLNNIVFGDVFLCSGQSNMQFTVSQAFNATEEIAASIDYPNLRVFTVAQKTSLTPLDDVKSAAPFQWGVSSPSVIGGPDWQYFSASCYFFGRDLYQALGDVPIGLLDSDWGGTPIEAWSSPDALRMCNQTTADDESAEQAQSDARDWTYYAKNKNAGVTDPPPNTPSVLWNGMINPLLPMRFAGAAWYQGEANEGAPTKYACQFPAMVNDWRYKFSLSLPFYFVQLAPWIQADGASGLFPALRWAQASLLSVENTGMAVAADSGDPGSPYGSIHPRFKQVVGSRLAANALAQQYGMNVPYQGAYVRAAQYPSRNNTAGVYLVQLWFTSTKLEFRGTEFCEECCDATDTFQLRDPMSQGLVPATAVIESGDSIVVSAFLSGSPTELYYAWSDYPECMIYNENHLPTPEIQMPLTQ